MDVRAACCGSGSPCSIGGPVRSGLANSDIFKRQIPKYFCALVQCAAAHTTMLLRTVDALFGSRCKLSSSSVAELAGYSARRGLTVDDLIRTSVVAIRVKLSWLKSGLLGWSQKGSAVTAARRLLFTPRPWIQTIGHCVLIQSGFADEERLSTEQASPVTDAAQPSSVVSSSYYPFM